jgi:hypothetical protein
LQCCSQHSSRTLVCQLGTPRNRIGPHRQQSSRSECILTVCCCCHTVLMLLCRGTLILGFEQATKYTVLDQDGNTVSTGRQHSIVATQQYSISTVQQYSVKSALQYVGREAPQQPWGTDNISFISVFCEPLASVNSGSHVCCWLRPWREWDHSAEVNPARHTNWLPVRGIGHAGFGGQATVVFGSCAFARCLCTQAAGRCVVVMHQRMSPHTNELSKGGGGCKLHVDISSMTTVA